MRNLECRWCSSLEWDFGLYCLSRTSSLNARPRLEMMTMDPSMKQSFPFQPAVSIGHQIPEDSLKGVPILAQPQEEAGATEEKNGSPSAATCAAPAWSQHCGISLWFLLSWPWSCTSFSIYSLLIMMTHSWPSPDSLFAVLSRWVWTWNWSRGFPFLPCIKTLKIYLCSEHRG